MTTSAGQPVLLDIDGLSTWFDTEDGVVKAVDGVSFRLLAGETLGVVGESGCGKSVTAMSILQLLPRPPARYAAGRIVFQGRDLLKLSEAELRRVRGNQIAMIFQEPMTSLNPVFTVGNQIMEVLQLHKQLPAAEARAQTLRLLERVGIPAPGTRIDEYPHQMSGGMKQRIMIAMALACEPRLLIADEPTTALDVTIQAQILELLLQMKQQLGMSILLITHDLGVVAETSDHVAVMYASKIVEYAETGALFERPLHPYTFGLFQSLPEMHATGDPRLREIPGTVPSPLQFPSGCKFRERCFKALPRCATDEPALVEVEPGHTLACHAPVTDAERAADHARRTSTPAPRTGDGATARPARGPSA